ncbi:hypothetical protein [Pseudomonas typographi]|uniref:Uncharacterized protein n=1 Tax=Pseudomonas typographi TaxID=2715964 RepID=A0ABR7ZA14_9PSED|nr:hypothetical protein [Pseudomonas typographi]MBD1555111.1 hypothetical protein [Pseudomonas typographi]MBD1602395.1 hypothetical protein [Pseudomonas typographi]
MTKPLAVLIIVLLTQGAFAAPAKPTVEAFIGDPIAILDAQGNVEGEMPLRDAPKGPLPILQYNEAIDLVQVELAGKKVWLDTLDLRMNPTKIVTLSCQEMKPGSPDKENNSTIGYGGCKE